MVGLGALLWAALLWMNLRRWTTRYDALTRGVEGEALEALLRRYIAAASAARDELDALRVGQQELSSQLLGAVQHVGLVRFDAFEDSGGRQSFVLALLDAKTNGTVLSAVYHRDLCRVYARPVVGGKAPAGVQLGEEEAEAIRRAQAPPQATDAVQAGRR